MVMRGNCKQSILCELSIAPPELLGYTGYPWTPPSERKPIISHLDKETCKKRIIEIGQKYKAKYVWGDATHLERVMVLFPDITPESYMKFLTEVQRLGFLASKNERLLKSLYHQT